MEIAKEHIKEVFQNLPPKRQEAILSPHLAERLVNIYEKNGISENVREQIGTYVTAYLVNLLSLEQLAFEIEHIAGHQSDDLIQNLKAEVFPLIEEDAESTTSPIHSLKDDFVSPSNLYWRSQINDPYREPVEGEPEAKSTEPPPRQAAIPRQAEGEQQAKMRSTSAQQYNFPHTARGENEPPTGGGRENREEAAGKERREEKYDDDSLDAQLLRETRRREHQAQQQAQPDKKAPAPPNLPTGENGQQRPSQDGGQGRKSNADPYREPIE